MAAAYINPIHLPGMRLWSVPEGQLLHDPAPDTALYVPAPHAVHVPPFGPVKPALHVQSEEASLRLARTILP